MFSIYRQSFEGVLLYLFIRGYATFLNIEYTLKQIYNKNIS